MLETFIKKYQDKIGQERIDTIQDIVNKIKSIKYNNLLIQYLKDDSIFITVIKDKYEIHLSYNFNMSVSYFLPVFYTLFYKNEVLEIGRGNLTESIERIKEVINNNAK